MNRVLSESLQIASVIVASVIAWAVLKNDHYYGVHLLYLIATGVIAWLRPRGAWRWGLLVAFVGPLLATAIRLVFGWPEPSETSLAALPFALPGAILVAMPATLVGMLVGAIRTRRHHATASTTS